MPLLGPIAVEMATAIGLLAGLIAVCGFLANAGPTLSGAPEEEIREATVAGGAGRLSLWFGCSFLSAIAARVIA